MKFSNMVRTHWAAFRALLVLTVVTGIAYPLFIWVVAQLPGLRDNANGSIIEVGGKAVGSSLIGQLFTDSDGNPLPQYFQGRPSVAGDGYDPMATSASNLGPESIIDTPGDPSLPEDDAGNPAGYRASLLTLVCGRSHAAAALEGVDGSRPFCTDDGVGAVLSVIGTRDAGGNVVNPTRVVSVNEPCETNPIPFLERYEGVRVECAAFGEDYSIGQIVPIRGAAPHSPVVPADAVTASASGLDPHISPAFAELQVKRVARARGVTPEQVIDLIAAHREERTLGILGEARVNVLALNVALDEMYPATS
ncbi:MAG: potassium-transporting ATPase subunit C [Mycolicibacterium sp.]|uniref:potassium-transporting ATPase subunit C n=1 Tax=Mycolicibacterium sp. TaxID=2320850 RepID=UPI003D0B8893